MNEVLVRDKKNRPLIVLQESGDIVFHRFLDMDEIDRDNVIKFYKEMVEKNGLVNVGNKGIEDFLLFKGESETDICG